MSAESSAQKVELPSDVASVPTVTATPLDTPSDAQVQRLNHLSHGCHQLLTSVQFLGCRYQELE